MERKPFPSETQDRFIVRFPDGMRDRIAEAAKANNRSMNAEIVARLQASFQPRHFADVVEESARVSDEVLTPRQMEIVREVATKAAQVVFEMQQGRSPVRFGLPSATPVQAPEPSKKKPTK